MEELRIKAQHILKRLTAELEDATTTYEVWDEWATHTQMRVYKLGAADAYYTEEQITEIYETHEDAMETRQAALEIEAAFAKAVARMREAVRAIQELEDMGL